MAEAEEVEVPILTRMMPLFTLVVLVEKAEMEELMAEEAEGAVVVSHLGHKFTLIPMDKRVPKEEMAEMEVLMEVLAEVAEEAELHQEGQMEAIEVLLFLAEQLEA